MVPRRCRKGRKCRSCRPRPADGALDVLVVPQGSLQQLNETCEKNDGDDP